MRSKFILTLIVISFIAQQCAKQTAPTGGPKDETPPKIKWSNPRDKQTKFRSEKIEILFDEFVQLNNPNDQIIITPTIGKKFEVTNRKNKVTLAFNASLQENTTYNINFRESIQDLTEKNPAVAKIAFSTGDYIDSLSISGIIKEILTDQPAKNYTVALTQASDTFNLFKHQASWITQADEEGKFVLENLKPGSYLIYTFDDKNKNLIVDSKSEKYGFKGEYITLEKSIENISIATFKLDASNLKLIASRPTFSYFLIRLSKGLASYTLSPINKEESLYSALEGDNASIKVYNTIKEDSIQVKLFALDSLDNKIDTLLYVKFNPKSTTKDKMQHKLEPVKYLETNSTLYTSLSFTKPIPFVNPDSIFIQLDSLTKISFSETDLEWDQSKTKLSVTKRYEIPKPSKATSKPIPSKPTERPLKQPGSSPVEKGTVETIKQTYNQLTFPKGTFISVELDTIPHIAEAIRKTTLEQTGIIMSKVETKENFIIQLINKNYQVIQEVITNKNAKFENLQPGIYQLRLIIDRNKNGKWDAGKAATKTEPEKIIFFTNSKNEKDINIKANWEVGPLLITD